MISRPVYTDKIMAYTDTPFVKVLTGVRRCGKSTILKMIMGKLQNERGVMKDQIVSMRFDSMEYDDMNAKQMFEAVKAKLCDGRRTYFFFDEVQEIDGWEKVVNSLASDYDVDIYVTGSNSRMMSSEIATYLTGRYISFRALYFLPYFPAFFRRVSDFSQRVYRTKGCSCRTFRLYSSGELSGNASASIFTR